MHILCEEYFQIRGIYWFVFLKDWPQHFWGWPVHGTSPAAARECTLEPYWARWTTHCTDKEDAIMKSDRDRCLFLLLAVYVKSTSYLASSGDSANTWYVLSSVTMFRAFSFSWLSTISLWSHKKDTRLRNSGSVWTSGPEIKRKFPLIQREAEEHARAAYNTF